LVPGSNPGGPNFTFDFDLGFAILDLVRVLLAAFEILILSALILATRCANYHDVFVDRNIYFIDADCYARMTRVRICAEHPGTVIRHHDFENFPSATMPHTEYWRARAGLAGESDFVRVAPWWLSRRFLIGPATRSRWQLASIDGRNR
jgi:hypothetical protein